MTIVELRRFRLHRNLRKLGSSHCGSQMLYFLVILPVCSCIYSSITLFYAFDDEKMTPIGHVFGTCEFFALLNAFH